MNCGLITASRNLYKDQSEVDSDWSIKIIKFPSSIIVTVHRSVAFHS